MKKIALVILCLVAFGTANAAPVGQGNVPSNPSNLKIRVLNFKRVAEQSKLGKKEQTSFEALKKQMESVLKEKEKVINEMASKFEDPDYLDSLSAEAETDMKRKFRALNQEFGQLQQQYLQTLQQTNFKVVQNLSEMVAKAATTLAQREKIDMILNDEVGFFVNPSYDVSSQIISILDEMPEQETQTKDLR
jgi:outer membrane protein